MKKSQSTLVEELVLFVSQNQSNQIMLDYATKNYDISLYKISNFQPDQILSLYQTISIKSYQQPQLYNEEFWFQNELKVFIWSLVAYSFQRQLLIQNFTNQQWLLFSQNFNNRPTDFFQFQANFIIHPNKLSKSWAKEQQELLKQIITKDQISNKWNFVARQLFKLSLTKFYKTPKQCRQRWLNHLDPSKKHTPWSADQDIQLFRSVKFIGKKWAQISKLFKNTRTQHMIKNRFKAIVYSYTKRFPKIKQEEVVEKFLSVHETQKKSHNHEKAEKAAKKKQKNNKKDPPFICRVSSKNRTLTVETPQNKNQKIPLQAELPINIVIEAPAIQSPTILKQAKIPIQRNIIEEMKAEEGERDDGMQFFEELDSRMSNIPFLLENEQIESFISKCMHGPGQEYLQNNKVMESIFLNNHSDY